MADYTSPDRTWYYWSSPSGTYGTNTYDSGTTNSSATCDNGVWLAWNSPTAATYEMKVTASNNTTWRVWVGEQDAGTSQYIVGDNTWEVWTYGDDKPETIKITQPVVLTEEEQQKLHEEQERLRLAREEQQRRMEAEAAERAKKLAEANAKARELLMSLLNPRQQKEYLQTNHITIFKGNKKKWVLTKKSAHNLFEYDKNGKRILEHCVYATGGVPIEDHLATQILYLENCPGELIARANHFPVN